MECNPETAKCDKYTTTFNSEIQSITINGESSGAVTGCCSDGSTIPGDTNCDNTVDIYDAITLSNAFGTSPGNSNWNPNADINGDGTVDIYDAIILANHFDNTCT
jgi:hypothetical protein